MLWKPTVDQRERIGELLDALAVGGVAGHQLEAVYQGDGGDHRIGYADGVADAFEVAPDTARHLGGRLAEFQHLLTGDIGEKRDDLLGSLHFL